MSLPTIRFRTAVFGILSLFGLLIFETAYSKGVGYQSGCLINGEKGINALLVFDIDSTATAGPRKGMSSKTPRLIRHIECSPGIDCIMIKIPIDANLSMMNLHTHKGKILNISKSLAMLDFGTNGTIVIDTQKGSATYHLSGPSFEDRGTAACK